MINKRNKKILLTILKFTFLAVVLLLTYFPLIIIALQSFNLNSTGTSFTGFTIKWYGEMFQDENLMSAITSTFVIAILSTLIATVFGTLSAIGISSLSKKKKSKLIFLNNIPILNADIVTAVFLLIIFRIIGNLIGIEYILGFSTLLIAHVLFSTPYVILSVLPKLSEIDNNLYDAATDLGCRPKRALWKVILPGIKTGIITGALLAFTMSIDDFVISYFVSGPDIDNFSIWLYTNRKISKGNPLPKASAYNTIITIITIVLVLGSNIIKNRKKGVKK